MANKIYDAIETTKWFVPATAAQAEDAAFECHNLSAGAGVQSAQLDLGTSSVGRWFQWAAFIQFATAPVLNEALRIYLKWSGTSASATAHPDNDDGTTASAVSAEDKLNNLHYLDSIVVDQATANIEMVRSGYLYVPARAVQVVFWNGTADALTNDVDENGFFMSAVVPEVQ